MRKIGVIFGGRSGEHEVSLMSATAVLNAIDQSKYIPVPIGVDRDGKWYVFSGDFSDIENRTWQRTATQFGIEKLKYAIDFAFPVIHGTQGEDGVLQGLLEIMDIPYAGCGVLASSLCMDKAMTKEVLARNGIPTCKYKLVRTEDLNRNMPGIVREIDREFVGPVFIKPANAGSSLGVSKVDDIMEMGKALALAGSFDRRILVEEAIIGREVETAVIGNNTPLVASVGEITKGSDFDFYDYEAKYTDSSGTRLDIPANLPEDVIERIREIAKKAYLACDCAGFARVDFFIEEGTGDILVNEINTIPGLTKYSLFPLLWEAEGINFTEMIEKIIEYGDERYNDKNSRQTLRRR